MKKSIGKHSMLSRCLGFRGYALENYGISKLRRGQQNFIIIWHMPSTPAYINLKSTVSHTALQYRGIQLFNIEDEKKRQKFLVLFFLYHIWPNNKAKCGLSWQDEDQIKSMQQLDTVKKRLFAFRETFFICAVLEEFDSGDTKLPGWPNHHVAKQLFQLLECRQQNYLFFPSCMYIRKKYFLSLLILVYLPGMACI